MKTKSILFFSLLASAAFSAPAAAQVSFGDVFNKFKLEARADAELQKTGSQAADYGIHGRYFNLMVGGDLGRGFSYYFRQRLRAESGSVHFFDNTDFLWVDYRPNEHWHFRFGKDAMAVGGYEYDAAPIDEHMVGEYWNNIYCFQLGAAATFTTTSGHSFVANVAQSPYINSRRERGEKLDWNASLLAYSVEWMGHIGEHVSTLWSTSMIERERGTFMNLTILGTQYTCGSLNVYLDLMHHALATDDWFKNYGLVARADYRLDDRWTLLAKGSYEQNRSEDDLNSPAATDPTSNIALDHLVPPGHRYWKFGAGCEFRPVESVRLHALVYEAADEHIDIAMTHSLMVNIGATWTMDFKRIFK